jgi:hypothetical protein
MSNWCINFCGLYYKPMTIVNDDSRVVNKLKISLTDDARVVIYNCHMFIVLATELLALKMGYSIRRLSNSLKHSLLCRQVDKFDFDSIKPSILRFFGAKKVNFVTSSKPGNFRHLCCNINDQMGLKRWVC